MSLLNDLYSISANRQEYDLDNDDENKRYICEEKPVFAHFSSKKVDRNKLQQVDVKHIEELNEPW